MSEHYAPWQPAAIYLDTTRRRVAAELLRACDAFPGPGARCLEVGFGELGWLGHLIGWGVRERDLYGIEARADLVRSAATQLPGADLRAGDAVALPWPPDAFDLVVASMVFTAIPAGEQRRRAAREIARVLVPGGALLWYDITVDNPWNRAFRKVTRSELRALFPGWAGSARAVGLAPPIARIVAPRSWALASLLEAVAPVHPFLVAVLRAQPGAVP